ncbi:MAG: hypothetical protein ACOYJB_08815 [Christensenellaceae bacterium]
MEEMNPKNELENEQEQVAAEETAGQQEAGEMSVVEVSSAEEEQTDAPNGEEGDVIVADADEEEIIPYQPKLTAKQQNVLQILLGFVFGFAIWLALALPVVFGEEGGLLGWLWVIIFAIAMFGKNAVQKRTGVSMRTFMKFFGISLVIFMGVFILTIGINTNWTFEM